MTKLKKVALKQDTVKSDSFHVGIELETYIPCESNDHDCDACTDNQRDYMENMSATDILRDYMGLNRYEADSVAPYFNSDEWVSDYMSDWSCDDSSCQYNKGDGTEARETLETDLTDLTENNSIKVVEDGSISHDESDSTDAEVCWNYYASKDTLNDNKIILEHLKSIKARSNNSCGLHINLNNYLKLDHTRNIGTNKLSFLFNLVDGNRQHSTYCNEYALANAKYSMIYNQGDRLEFRFFSPTFDHVTLNHYVSLANVVYKRLCGLDAKLSKKSMRFFLKKMMTDKKLSLEVASDTLKKLNSLKSYKSMLEAMRVKQDKADALLASMSQVSEAA